ncbi:DUF4260 domain-containing protein [Ornithinibacillus salinisoli]|uniref:DUF4260 domain-containing protein n=1 Tax=Ornithinibacillus salinisoli TaxID=1848459 RepID=A0ABW4VXH6_9BACI
MVKVFLHIEGLATLLLSIFVYFYFDLNWLLFVLLLFAPDLSMLGYLFNNHLGAILYNIFHTYIVPILLVFIAFLVDHSILMSIGLIWFAHIGMDRMIGYGLKYPTDFKNTHLNRV